MGNEELMALLESLQGSGTERAKAPGILAQVPSLVAANEARSNTSSAPASPASALRTLSSILGPAASSLLGTAGSSIGGTAASSLGGPATSSIASSALRSMGGGLTLLPAVSGLLKLFGVGKEKEALPALEKYELPAPIRAEAGLSQSGETFLIDRGAGDRIRQLPAPPTAPSFAGSQGGSIQASTGASITVNVQAMDSQSFMDRREDIARAVREAMLQSHSLNDVVNEL